MSRFLVPLSLSEVSASLAGLDAQALMHVAVESTFTVVMVSGASLLTLIWVGFRHLRSQ